MVFNLIPKINSDGTFAFPGFQAIEYQNGALMSVNPPYALREDYKKEEELNQVLKYNAENGDNNTDQKINEEVEDTRFNYRVHKEYYNSKKFNVTIDNQRSTWCFGSVISSRTDVDKGSSLENKISVLNIEFESAQPLKSFSEYYGYLSTLLSFMTFRKFRGFESIKLMYLDDKIGYIPFADCYVRTSEGSRVEENGSVSSDFDNAKIKGYESPRSSMNSLSVHLLTNDVFQNMLNGVVSKDKKKTKLPISFIPTNSRDAGYITYDKIRNVCTDLDLKSRHFIPRFDHVGASTPMSL
ncbi:hypothetical protein [Butyrivibrio sp. WCD2001]|uniref:hypothetical protein n=1 Tax=Butyrivibrio sp. WCD2001 TaxID=1280681 RepID=UPI0003F5202D|nr:hypothetical protein [Butyrivibrio sp. WCD2001]